MWHARSGEHPCGRRFARRPDGLHLLAKVEPLRQRAPQLSANEMQARRSVCRCHQLHGHESPDYIRALRVVDGFPVDTRLIKAISVSGRDDIATYKPYEGLVDYFLFDTKCPSVGGSGLQFDWSVLSAYDGNTPFLLSGGIGPDDAERLTSHLSPLISKHCIGIDLNSRFEVAPALKDINKLKEFIKKVRI